MRVSVGGNYFENSIMQLEDGNVERASSQVVDGDNSVLLFVEAVGQRSSGWLVYQTQYLKACDSARIFGGLALCVVEVCGHCDDSFAHRGAEGALCIALQLARNKRRDFG